MQGSFLWNLFVIGPVVFEKKIFLSFLYSHIRKTGPAPGGHVFWDIKILWTILVEIHQRIIPVKLIWNWTSSFGEEDFFNFPYSHISKTGPTPGSHVFWDIKILWTTLVEVHPRIISVKLFWNWTSSFGEEDFQSFLYIAYKENWPRPWRPCFLRYQNSLNNFGRGSPKDHSYKIYLKLDQWFWRFF